MDKIDKMIEQARSGLNECLNQLKMLEDEKKKIIELYKKAEPQDRVVLEKKMKESEAKFKKLYEDTMLFSVKIKELKNHIVK